MEHVQEFNYLGSVLDGSSTNGPEFPKKVASGRKSAGAIRTLVNIRSLQFQCTRVLHESLLVSVLM